MYSKTAAFQKPNLSLYSPYYAEACNKLAVPISESYRQGNTATYVNVEALANRLQRCVRFGRSLGNELSTPPAHEARV